MGYGKDDELAINTIRLLAVSWSTPPTDRVLYHYLQVPSPLTGLVATTLLSTHC